MPRTPSWLGRIDGFEREIAACRLRGWKYIDRKMLQAHLGVSSRRAQQLMAGLPGETFGTSLVVERDALLKRLRSIAAGEDNSFESERRAHFAAKLGTMRRERIENPRVEVEAPIAVLDSRISQLPAGVTLEPGRIAVQFDTATEALERLLALAMAIGNDPAQFEELVSKP